MKLIANVKNVPNKENWKYDCEVCCFHESFHLTEVNYDYCSNCSVGTHYEIVGLEVVDDESK